MNLPITDSILRGELRPNILVESLVQKDLDYLIRNARKISKRKELTNLEFAINDVLGNYAETEETYAEDRKTRDAAIKANKGEVFKNKVEYKYPSTEVIIDNTLPLPELSSPLLHFYNSIIDAEVLRTRQAVLRLCTAIQDDAFMRSTLKALFRKIKSACREANQWDEHQEIMALISIKLTNLYFSLLNTYDEVLESYETPEYEDDFMDFVYGWRRVYPTVEEESNYLQQTNNKKAIICTDVEDPIANPQNNSGVDNEQKTSKDKADIFLDNVKDYNFLGMPKIQQLKSPKKIHDLVLKMLDTPGHACAMLEYLGFYDWIKNTQEIVFKIGQYEQLCSKVVMGKDNSNAFHNVRMSLKKENVFSGRYKAYMYIEQVKNEYYEIINNIKTN